VGVPEDNLTWFRSAKHDCPRKNKLNKMAAVPP
jgi:hypothetical protein